MASSLVISCNKKSSTTKTVSDRRPLMLLKDYLLDDMSSCSSNGFKSFPRRGHCCPPTVRFLIDADLSNNFSSYKKRRRSRKGAIRKASEAVINAVKLLQPFPSFSSSSSVKSATPLSKLPRSFSRKLFKRGYFWRKMAAADKEKDVRRWTYFHVEPDRTPKPEKLIVSTAVYSTTTSSSSGSSNGDGNHNRNNWEFSNSESSGNDAVAEEERSWSTGREKVSVGEEGVTSVGGVEAEEGSTNKEWHNEHKEQFSPVSVLDCPFEDEEEITSPLTGSLVHFEAGTKKKLIGKLRRFESLTKLEPVDLRKRFALAESESEPLDESPRTTNPRNSFSSELLKENGIKNKAKELLSLAEATVSSPIRTTVSKVDNLLLDFFREQIERNDASEGKAKTGDQMYEEELALAKDWLNGNPQEVILGWEVREGRQVYLRDMERHWVLKSLEEKEGNKAEVALELESEAFNLLMEEVLIDFCS